MSDQLNQDTQDRPLNILLVDDNESDLKITLRAFAQAKLKNAVFPVHSGRECLDFLGHQGSYQDHAKYPVPDLILLDINMPVMDGFKVLSALKADLGFRDIPVIMFSASNNEQDVAKSYALGASSFIQKPVAYEDFVKVVEGFNFYWHAANRLPRRKE